MRTIIFTFILLSAVSPVLSRSIQIQPSRYQINLTAGDSVNKTLAIKGIGFSYPVVCFLETKITQLKEDEIQVSYSVNPFILYPTRPTQVTATISAKINTAPGLYWVESKAYTKVYTKVETRTRTRWKVNQTLLAEYRNLTEAYWNLKNQTREINHTLQGLLDWIDELRRKVTERDREILELDRRVFQINQSREDVIKLFEGKQREFEYWRDVAKARERRINQLTAVSITFALGIISFGLISPQVKKRIREWFKTLQIKRYIEKRRGSEG